MKEMIGKLLENKKILILIAIVAVIIGVGIWITLTKGLNYDVVYAKHTRLSIYIEADFTDKDIKQMAKEVLGTNQIYIQHGLSSDKEVWIIAKQISDEQIESMVQKVNEKYGIEITKKDHTFTSENGNVRGRYIVMPYIIQAIITTVVVTAYLCVIYRKVGIIKSFFMIVISLIIAQLLYLSALAIIRIPINLFTMPIALVIYVISIIGVTMKLAELKEKKEPKKSK